MVTAVGVDIVEVARIRRLIYGYGQRFLVRVLGPDELALLQTRRDSAEFVAGRFAAKEALVKALGRYLTVRPGLTQLEIITEEGGQPSVRFDQSLNPALASVRTSISISHEKSYAVAMAVLSEES
jgi:holo-[acyl-carrier protein] synthase